MTEAGSQWSNAFAAAPKDAMLVYDRVIARMFTPWAVDLLERLAPKPGMHALDVACGPGTVTHLLAQAVGSSGRVTATDISPAMLAIARDKPMAEDAAPIEWIEAPATPLPFPDDSFDVVACQQGLQFFPDKVASLAEMRRVLRDGGIAGVAVWTSVEDQIFHVLHDALAATLGNEKAARYRGPFLLSGEEAAAAAAAAGFADVHLERVSREVELEGGVPELYDTLAASGIAADIAALNADETRALQEEVARLSFPYLQDDVIRGTLTASVLLLS